MTPAAQVRARLAAARDAGIPFAEAWPAATAAALAGTTPWHAAAWATVLAGHEHEWRAAYHRVPAGGAAAALGAVRELAEPEPADRAALAAR